MPKKKPTYQRKKCTARTSAQKRPCNRWAILGGTVCATHGGRAKQVKEAARRRLALADITSDRTLLELGRIAYGTPATFFDEKNNVIPPSELDDDQRAILAGFEACVENVQTGDGKQDWIHKFKTHNKVQALEILAKYFGHAKTPDAADRAPIIVNAKSVQIAQMLTPQELLLLRERIQSGHAAGNSAEPRNDRASVTVPARK